MSLPPAWKSEFPLGVIAPSSTPSTLEELPQGLAALSKDGYTFQWDPDQLSQQGYLSGTDLQRATQFNESLALSRYLIAVRGGYGCLRILDQIDYSIAQHHPGVLIGFSDLTALQLSLYHRAGWKSISGPLVVEWNKINATMRRDVKRLLEGKIPRPITGLTTERSGTCTGILIGGNLSMIVRMIGSEFFPDLSGKILFIEDINEPAYKIDGLLTQLRHARVLDQLGGLILGSFLDASPMNRLKEQSTIVETVRSCVADYQWPLVSGLDYGHFLPRCVLPVGIKAMLTADPSGACLEIMEPLTN